MALALVLLQQWWQELCKISLTNPFVFSLLLLVSFMFLLKLTKGGSKLNLPPSPPKLPIINHLHLLSSLPHRSLHSLSKEYGPIVLLYLGRAPTLVVSSAEIAKEIMKTQDNVFANRFQTRAAKTLMYGCNDLAFAPHGEYWRQMRRICVSELLSVKRVKSFQFVREEEVAGLIEQIRRASLDGASVNLGEKLTHISSSIVCRCVLGRKYDGEDSKKRFGELAKTAMELMGGFCFRDFFPISGWMDVLTGFVKRLKETSEGFDAFLDEVIKEHRNSKVNYDDQPDKKCLVEILLHLEKAGVVEIDLTEDNLKAVLLDMFIGAIDTTSVTLEWAMAEMMKNQVKMKKAQEEVRRVVGKKSKVDEDDLHQMDYLKCVIKEALRLHPAGPFLVRQELTDSAKLEGYDIPHKARVLINAWSVQRDPRFWDSPDEFLPERFVNNPVDFKGQDFQFIPFGAGRRGCPGISFAAIQAENVLANLLYWFDWKCPDGASGEDLDMSELSGFAVHKKIPLQLVPLLHSP